MEALANKAFDRVTGHEEVCVERYQAIKEALSEIKAAQVATAATITTLVAGANKSEGKWMGIALIFGGGGFLVALAKVIGVAL